MHEENKKQLKNLVYNIKCLRKEHKLSKEEMAKLLNITSETIATIEKGEIPSDLTIDVLFTIWKIFGVHPIEQFGKKLDE